jgi:hypothetical protein
MGRLKQTLMQFIPEWVDSYDTYLTRFPDIARIAGAWVRQGRSRGFGCSRAYQLPNYLV